MCSSVCSKYYGPGFVTATGSGAAGSKCCISYESEPSSVSCSKHDSFSSIVFAIYSWTRLSIAQSRSPVQSAQEFRNQAFNSLYNQGTLAPPQTASQAPWSGMQQGQQQQQMNQQQPYMQGQQPNMAMGASNGQVAQSGWMNANGAPQQQT